MPRALFFCSASAEIDPRYNELAREAVRTVARKGYGVVSGGTIKGTMEHVCDEASKYGVEVKGVLPRFMKGLEHPRLTSLVWTDTMSERKEGMREGTDLAIALPGGIGTLDELSETFCLAKMRIYKGKVLAFNVDGFWDGFRSQLEHFVETGMLTKADYELISFPSSIEELEKLV